jgi:Cu-processing system ATP-binding protein
MITISNLEKRFGKLEVLSGISLQFERSGITAILGPNGSGKTTLIKSILGMVLPSKGEVTFAGQDIRGQWAYRSQIDYLPQIARFPDNITVQELLDMIRDIRKKLPARLDSLIARFGIEPYLDKKLGTLSGGTKQKVNIVQAFMYDSPVVILDEPTNGLDPVALIELKNLLQEEKDRGKMLLITTHIMNFVEEMADDVVFLLDGHIYYRGAVPDLLRKQGATNLERAIADILTGSRHRTNGHVVEPKKTSLKLGTSPA